MRCAALLKITQIFYTVKPLGAQRVEQLKAALKECEADRGCAAAEAAQLVAAGSAAQAGAALTRARI